MKIVESLLYKNIFVSIMYIISLTSLIGCQYGKPSHKIGYHLEKINDIHYNLSLEKIDTMLALEKIMHHFKAIEKLNDKIQSHELMKDFLVSFVKKWTSKELILASFTDGKCLFMMEVNTFFLRGYVKSGEGWKTLFPIFKP